MWDDGDFWSNDPMVRFNAHQAAKGRTRIADPDETRKAAKENKPAVADLSPLTNSPQEANSAKNAEVRADARTEAQ